jgi:hypothetical protein
VMVDRSEFDARLADLAERRGAIRFQPARVRSARGEPGDWQLLVTGPDRERTIHARIIVEARGRSARSARARLEIGPATLAIWSHVAGDLFPRETRIEAIDRAWLWGSPLPHSRYRVMAFLGVDSRRKGAGLERLFRDLLAAGALFEPAAATCFDSPLFTRSATSFLDMNPWRPGAIIVGEMALALDPLSSSGVEKSMRSALQAVIAVNTVLHDPGDAELAREFYESRLVESAALHAKWTRGYYRQAWPGIDHAFWRERSAPLRNSRDRTGLIARYQEVSDRLEIRETKNQAATPWPDEFFTNADLVGSISKARVRVSPLSSFIDLPCVVDERVQLLNAIAHPNLDRPVAFLADNELVPLLKIVPSASDLGHLLALWLRSIPSQTAARIMRWLLQQGILTVETRVDD